MFRTLRDIFLIGFTLAGLFAACQVPGYVQEYEQRLGGARDEVTRLLGKFTAIAAGAGTDLAAYTVKLTDTDDPSISATGREIMTLSEREAAMAAHAEASALSSRFMKPVVVAQAGDREIMAATWKAYRHTLTLDPEFGAIGLGVGWLVYIILAAIVGAMMPRPRYRVRAEKLRRSRS
ncbi:MAG: DUF2937 family protein [Alphaproteobacteria bacterium]|nr:DUF2937 family protein [Alphaproteobacteria bacterium]